MRAFFDLVALAEPVTIELWRSHQLTLVQVQCLRRLRAGPLMAGDLARATGVSAASMTRLLERLEDRGLVVRAPDPADRRRVLVSLTDRGRSTLGGLDFWVKSPVWRTFAAMEADEREQITAVLVQLGERIRRASEGDQPAGARAPAGSPADPGRGPAPDDRWEGGTTP
ncbi:MAG: MarR family transcriptional regulator [Actinomycetia bacterium]|nr:MarR family transcriptional regulator [Actinomycetes bacterium]